MKIIVVNKIPLLKLCREFFRLEFGIVDFDELLECLCTGIHADARDRDHIGNMVYGDAWLQGHHEPYTDDQKMRLYRFLIDLRGIIVRKIHDGGRVSYHRHIHYVAKYRSTMSLKFEVIE